jgi:hypothetical protein
MPRADAHRRRLAGVRAAALDLVDGRHAGQFGLGTAARPPAVPGDMACGGGASSAVPCRLAAADDGPARARRAIGTGPRLSPPARERAHVARDAFLHAQNGAS